MSDWLISIEGTEAGARLALFLAILAAFLHALFGALQKGRIDPWTSRAVIDGSYALMALPFALFVVPWPEPHMWPIFAAAWAIHVGYKLAQASAYSFGAYTVVYPVVRGTGPLFTVIGAYPRGQHVDMCFGKPGERPGADQRIAALQVGYCHSRPQTVADQHDAVGAHAHDVAVGEADLGARGRGRPHLARTPRRGRSRLNPCFTCAGRKTGP